MFTTISASFKFFCYLHFIVAVKYLTGETRGRRFTLKQDDNLTPLIGSEMIKANLQISMSLGRFHVYFAEDRMGMNGMASSCFSYLMNGYSMGNTP